MSYKEAVKQADLRAENARLQTRLKKYERSNRDKDDLKTFGGRLYWAVYQRGSIRDFVEAMKSSKSGGISEPSIYRYLDGKTEPSLVWITEAAALLKVDRAWLAFGEPYPSLGP